MLSGLAERRSTFAPVIRFSVLLLFVVVLSACRYTAPDFQQEHATPPGGWKYDYAPKFSFEITDTASAYQLYLILLHTNAYPFSNIWVRLQSK